MARIYDEVLTDATLTFTASEPGTIRYQIDSTASYANAAAMDAAAGSAELTGTVAAPVGNGLEAIDTTSLTSDTWYIHLVLNDGSNDSNPVSVSFTKIATAEGAGTSAGAATVSGVGISTAASAGTADAIATVLGVGISTAAASGASDGSATVSGVGSTADNVQEGAGSSDGTSTASAVGASTAASLGISDGVATVSGVGSTAGGAFTPADLFAASEQGAWYDPSDLSTLWQDTAGTTAVTADGQAVARIDDKSGNGNNATQATASQRPIYRTSGGLHWLEFDGTDDKLALPFNIFATNDEVFLAIQRQRDTASVYFGTVLMVKPSNGALNNDFRYVRFAYKHNAFGATSGNTILGFGGIAGNGDALSGNIGTTEKSVVYWRQATSMTTRYNGVDFATGATPDSDKGSGASGGQIADDGYGNYGKFNFFGMIYVAGPKTSTEIGDTEDWLNGKIGAY